MRETGVGKYERTKGAYDTSAEYLFSIERNEVKTKEKRELKGPVTSN